MDHGWRISTVNVRPSTQARNARLQLVTAKNDAEGLIVPSRRELFQRR